jgi:hypothetical protein
MSTTRSITPGRTFTVVESMRENGAMTVRSPAGETYELVDYVDDLLCERLSSLTAGATVRLETTPVEGCEKVRVATRLVPGWRPTAGL